MDGTVVKLADDFTIDSFIITKSEFRYNEVLEYYKTVNIYKFSKSFLNQYYVPFLEAYSNAFGNNQYYEQVLKIIINIEDVNLHALPLNGELWYEVDDIQDLDNANLLFASENEAYQKITKDMVDIGVTKI